MAEAVAPPRYLARDWLVLEMPEALQRFTRVLCYAFVVDEYILIII